MMRFIHTVRPISEHTKELLEDHIQADKSVMLAREGSMVRTNTIDEFHWAVNLLDAVGEAYNEVPPRTTYYASVAAGFER